MLSRTSEYYYLSFTLSRSSCSASLLQVTLAVLVNIVLVAGVAKARAVGTITACECSTRQHMFYAAFRWMHSQ